MTARSTRALRRPTAIDALPAPRYGRVHGSVWLAALLLLLPFAVPAAAATFTVTAASDGADAAPGDGVCADAAGTCTLRAAIAEANARPGADVVAFAVAGAPSIAPGGALPAVTDALTLDGTTQPGGSVVVLGADAGASTTGLVLDGGNATLRGLDIREFGGRGILVRSAGNTVSGCTVTANHGAGVAIAAGVSNRLAGNAIAGNGGLGIDLGDDDAVEANDPGDADGGPNGRQNFPELESVTTDGSSVHVQLRLLSVPDATFTVELFASRACDGSGHGEGATVLGSAQVTTDAAGRASLRRAFPLPDPDATVVTATATDAAGNTSEFSPCPAVLAPRCIEEPGGLAVDAAGNLYVSDRAQGFVGLLNPETATSIELPPVLEAPGDIDVAGCALFVGEAHDVLRVPLGVAGRVLDVDDTPVAGAYVEAASPLGARSRRVTTDAAGIFVLDLDVVACEPLPALTLFVQVPGDADDPPRTVRVQVAAETAERNLLAIQAGDLRLPRR